MRPTISAFCAAGLLLACFNRCAVAQSGDGAAPLISSGHPPNASTSPSGGVRLSLSDNEPTSVLGDEATRRREPSVPPREAPALSDRSWTATPAQSSPSATQSSRSIKHLSDAGSASGDGSSRQRANPTPPPLQPLPPHAAPLQPVSSPNEPPQSGESPSDAPRARPAPGGVQSAADAYSSPGTSHLRSAVAQAQFTSTPVNSPEPARASGSSKATSDAHRPLKPPTATDPATDDKRSTGTLQMFISVISSLLIVVGLMLGAAWCYRKATPNIAGGLPKQALQVLGRTPLAPRQQLVLVRFGPKLVLMSNLQGEVRTISEIVDPLEVDRICGMCESSQAGSISDSFRTVLHNIGRTG